MKVIPSCSARTSDSAHGGAVPPPCWGGGDYGQAEGCVRFEPEVVPGRWCDVSAYLYSVSAIRADGTLWRKQDEVSSPFVPGDGDAGVPDASPFVQVGTHRWRSLSSGIGPMEICGVREDEKVACVPQEASAETVVEGVEGAVMVAARDHACAVTVFGVQCWGRNEYGQASGAEPPAVLLVPVLVDERPGWTKVITGLTSSCGLREGRAYCWGADPSSSFVLGREASPGTAGVMPVDPW